MSQAKGLTLEIDSRGNMPTGYTPYRYSFSEQTYFICKWYVYPFYKAVEKAKNCRAGFYAWLNSRGIMNTPDGCIMKLSDIIR